MDLNRLMESIKISNTPCPQAHAELMLDSDAKEDLRLYQRYLDYCEDLRKLRPRNAPMSFLDWKHFDEIEGETE